AFLAAPCRRLVGTIVRGALSVLAALSHAVSARKAALARDIWTAGDAITSAARPPCSSNPRSGISLQCRGSSARATYRALAPPPPRRRKCRDHPVPGRFLGEHQGPWRAGLLRRARHSFAPGWMSLRGRSPDRADVGDGGRVRPPRHGVCRLVGRRRGGHGKARSRAAPWVRHAPGQRPFKL